MALADDGDLIRGLGYVALYAAYLEEEIDNLLVMLEPIEAYTESERRRHVSSKIDKAKRLLNNLTFNDRDVLYTNLNGSQELFRQRNEIVHGRIYANFNRPDTLRSGRPNVPERAIDSAELYNLANRLQVMQGELYRPMIFQIPEALASLDRG
ncbi:MAG: hypothetical protein ACRECH_11660 [Nitrososphaerales archaeon]